MSRIVNQWMNLYSHKAFYPIFLAMISTIMSLTK